MESKQVPASVIAPFRMALEALNCPYLETGEDWWVSELLFDPGKHRLQLLSWLLELFDPRLQETLEDVGMSKEHRFLQVVSEMGLCKKDELQLITGHASVRRQTAFWKLLLQALPEEQERHCVLPQALPEEQQRHCVLPQLLSEEQERHFVLPQLLDDQEEERDKKYQFIDCLADEEKLQKIFNPKVSLIPRDITRELQRQGSETNPIPQTDHLRRLLSTIQEQLDSVQDSAEKLRTEMSHSELYDVTNTEQEKTDEEVKVVVSQLNQLMTAFNTCYYTKFQTWISRPGDGPQISELGAVFHKIHGLLSNLTKFLSDMHSLKASCHEVGNIAEAKQISQKMEVSSVNTGSLFLCANLIETMQGIVSTMDDEGRARNGKNPL